MSPSFRTTAIAVLALVNVGCAGEREPAPPPVPVPPQVVEVTTNEYAFTAPDSITAGWVTLRMTAQGKELHHVQVVRFDEGHSFADFMAELQKGGGPPPSWVRLLGGANGADPGAATETSLQLDPGNYALICSIPAADGKPHFAKGMIRPLTVTGPATAAAAPTADVTLMISAAGFSFSGPLSAGNRTIRVENGDSLPHEAILIKLADGATATSLVDWLLGGMQGPPPGSGRGGSVGLERGAFNLVHANLTPGNYAVVDFMPNPVDGRPNAAHGMRLDFTVTP